MTRLAPWHLVLAFVVATPLLVGLSVLAHLAPWTGLPRYAPVLLPNGKVADVANDLWSSAAFTLLGFALIALLARGDFHITLRDRWLALMLAVVGLMAFYRGPLFNPTHAFFFALGC